MKERVLPPTYLFVAIIVMVAFHFLFKSTVVIPFPWSMFGIILLVVGFYIAIVADAQFKKIGTTIKPFEESSELVTDGMFRFSRHPMYLGFALALLGIAVIMGSITPFIVVIIFTILMEVIFIRIEESMVAEKFGDEWIEYKKSTRKWL